MEWSGTEQNGAITQNILEEFLSETRKVGVLYPLYSVL